MNARTVVLAVAKAPVPGRVKTRLAADVGDHAAAALAAAALRDTLAACSHAFGPGHRYLALDGDLTDAVDGPALLDALGGWTVLPQRGEGLAERLAAAHADVAEHAAATRVVQVGMDTPQLTAGDLRSMCPPPAASRGESGAEASYPRQAVLGLALDGGWWAVSFAEPGHAEALRDVPMSTATTGADTRAALVRAGADVTDGPVLRDVDTVTDAHAVARLAPRTRFARSWASVVKGQAS